jgi:protein arginine kinase activator
MICQHCEKNVATVHVTELLEGTESDPAAEQVLERHLCEGCAQEMDLPHTALPAKTMADIWKLLQLSAQQTRSKRKAITCPDCNMTLEELRRGGRLGCPKDYEVFKEYLGELLERMHGAREHVGRVPGLDENELERINRIQGLRGELDAAVREEDYERAAHLRDELKDLEAET